MVFIRSKIGAASSEQEEIYKNLYPKLAKLCTDWYYSKARPGWTFHSDPIFISSPNGNFITLGSLKTLKVGWQSPEFEDIGKKLVEILSRSGLELLYESDALHDNLFADEFHDFSEYEDRKPL